VGGGDGGTIREILKHQCVERAVLAEIDGEVIRVCEEYFPGLAGCLRQDPRVELAVGDGFKYLAEHADSFDIILSDSTDPIGPGAALFDDEYFALAKQALRTGGVFVTQCKSLWTDVETAWEIERRLQRQFKHVGAFGATIPTYPTGSWSFMFGSDEIELRNVADPNRQREISASCRYYTPEHQTAAFALPAFFRRSR
jgi:spermidine synthase